MENKFHVQIVALLILLAYLSYRYFWAESQSKDKKNYRKEKVINIQLPASEILLKDGCHALDFDGA